MAVLVSWSKSGHWCLLWWGSIPKVGKVATAFLVPQGLIKAPWGEGVGLHVEVMWGHERRWSFSAQWVLPGRHLWYEHS